MHIEEEHAGNPRTAQPTTVNQQNYAPTSQPYFVKGKPSQHQPADSAPLKGQLPSSQAMSGVSGDPHR